MFDSPVDHILVWSHINTVQETNYAWRHGVFPRRPYNKIGSFLLGSGSGAVKLSTLDPYNHHN